MAEFFIILAAVACGELLASLAKGIYAQQWRVRWRGLRPRFSHTYNLQLFRH